MKTIIMDSGPIISLALNNLLWVLEKMPGIKFCITGPVKKEIIDNPLTSKRFKLEALQVMRLVDQGTLKVIPDDPDQTHLLLDMANQAFTAQGRALTIVHYAEMSAVVAFLAGADAVMIDERTTRYLMEKPQKLRYVLSHKLHTRVDLNAAVLRELFQRTKNVKFIRSAEFVTVAFEKGLLDDFLPHIGRQDLLDALLWGLKLNGCAISRKDLEALERLSLKNVH